MTHGRMAVATIGVALLAAAGVLAFLPLRWATTRPGAVTGATQSRATVACASPFERWTGHDYDRPTDPASVTTDSYESRVLAVEAGESSCLLESGDHEELLTILGLVGVALLAAAAAGRRPGADRTPPAAPAPPGGKLHLRTRRAA